MAVHSNTGGVKTFIDDGSHQSKLTTEESARIDEAYTKARKRQSTLRYKIRKFFTGKSD